MVAKIIIEMAYEDGRICDCLCGSGRDHEPAGEIS